MTATRLEAFSDGVIAIIITIMVLELKVPHGATPAALHPLLPVFLSYVLSFVYVAIYWNNHHYLIRAAKHVDAKIMWANMHLLFWLSLVPFATAWWGENHGGSWPTALYGVVLLMAGYAYSLLKYLILLHHGKNSAIARALGKDWKGKLSLIFYLTAVGLSFFNQWASTGLYILVAGMWFVPDRRLEPLVAGE